MINTRKYNKWIGIFFSIFVIMLFSYFISIITNSALYSTFFSLSLIFIAIIFNLRKFISKKLIFIYLLIILVKIAFLIYQATNKNLPLGGVDWIYYHNFGEELLSLSNGDLLSLITLGNYDLFTRITAFIYFLFGVNPEQMYFYVFLSSLIVFNYIYLTSIEILNDKKKAQIIALLYLIWPIEFIHSITFLREMPIQLLFIMSIYYFVRFIKYRRIKYVIFAIVLISLAAMMHSGMIGVLLTYIFILIISSKKRGIDSFNPIKFLIFILIVTTFLQSPISKPLTGKFGGVNSVNDVVENKFRDSGLDATTNYINHIPESTGGLILQFPYLFSMYSLSPLPWQVKNFSTLLAFFIEGIPRLFIVYMLIKYFIKYKPKTPKEKQLKMTFMILILLTYLIFSLGTKSYGTAMRHRAKIFPLEIILVYSAININKRNRKYNIDLGSPELKKRKDGN